MFAADRCPGNCLRRCTSIPFPQTSQEPYCPMSILASALFMAWMFFYYFSSSIARTSAIAFFSAVSARPTSCVEQDKPCSIADPMGLEDFHRFSEQPITNFPNLGQSSSILPPLTQVSHEKVISIIPTIAWHSAGSLPTSHALNVRVVHMENQSGELPFEMVHNGAAM